MSLSNWENAHNSDLLKTILQQNAVLHGLYSLKINKSLDCTRKLLEELISSVGRLSVVTKNEVMALT